MNDTVPEPKRPRPLWPRPRPHLTRSMRGHIIGLAMPLSPGDRVDPYEILDLLGAGGMGEVYRARDTSLDRAVAVKVLPASMAADGERLERFEREARTLASLNHPHIAQVYGLEHALRVPVRAEPLDASEPSQPMAASTRREGEIMAGQGIERREVLRMLALASAVSAAPGFHRWTFAFGDQGPHHGTEPPRADAYTPRFFTADEYALVALLASLIVPTDATPGAAEAGVSEFIDTMVSYDAPLQARFRGGLAWLDASTRLRKGRPFEALGRDGQIAILEPLAYKARYRDGDEEGRRFFTLMREYTVMGFYTSRIGLEQLDAPGLQTYSESPGCPDPSDPEHRHRSARQLARTGPADASRGAKAEGA